MASHFKSLVVQMLICIEISLFLTSSVAMDFSDGLGRSTKRFCGRMLTDSLALICDGQYGTIVPMDKRSGTYKLYNMKFIVIDVRNGIPE